jgi:hypothetical protein
MKKKIKQIAEKSIKKETDEKYIENFEEKEGDI